MGGSLWQIFTFPWIGLPSFFVLNTLFGLRRDFGQAVRALMATQAGLAIDDSNRDRIGVVVGTGIGGISTLIEQWEVMKEHPVISDFILEQLKSFGWI